LGKFFIFVQFVSGFQIVGFSNLGLPFQFSFCRWSKFWLIWACGYLASLSVKSLWHKFFPSAVFMVGFVGSQKQRNFFGRRFW